VRADRSAPAVVSPTGLIRIQDGTASPTLPSDVAGHQPQPKNGTDHSRANEDDPKLEYQRRGKTFVDVIDAAPFAVPAPSQESTGDEGQPAHDPKKRTGK